MRHLHHLRRVQHRQELHIVEGGRVRASQREGEDDGRDLRQRAYQVENVLVLFMGYY